MADEKIAIIGRVCVRGSWLLTARMTYTEEDDMYRASHSATDDATGASEMDGHRAVM